jgi:hypothetical protein
MAAKPELLRPNLLYPKEFEALSGSSYMESMINNRFVINGDMTIAILTNMKKWLSENCKSLYYITNELNTWSNTLYIYIVDKSDAALFKMFWENIVET